MLNDRKQPRLYENPKLTHIRELYNPYLYIDSSSTSSWWSQIFARLLVNYVFTQPEYKQDIHTHAKYAIQSSFHLPKPLIVRFMYLSKSQEYKKWKVHRYLFGESCSEQLASVSLHMGEGKRQSFHYSPASLYLSFLILYRTYTCL